MTNIIVVEDDSVFTMILKKKLGESYPNEKINFFNSGEEGINNVTDDTILAIVDFMLGDILGIDVIKEMKKKNPNMEFIMMSGTPINGVGSIASKIGVFDYIKKGDNFFDKLKNPLNTILAIDRLRKEFNQKLMNLK